MKWTFTILAVLAAFGTINAVPPFGKGPLHDDLQDFANLIPHDRIVEIISEYLQNDPEVQKFVQILLGPEIKELIRDVEAFPEVIELFNYLHNHGIYIYDLVNHLNRFLGLDELVPPTDGVKTFKQTGGVLGLYKDIANVIPVEKLVELHTHKIQTSSAYADFVNEITSEKYKSIGEKIANNKNFKNFVQRVKDAGIKLVDTEDIFATTQFFFELQPFVAYDDNKSQLKKDFEDFLKLVPVEKVKEIVLEYLVNDEEVQRAVKFVQSKEYHELIYAVEALPEYQELVIYLNNAGLDVYEAIQRIHELLGMDDYVPPSVNVMKRDVAFFKITGGFAGLIVDVKAVIPFDKIDALYEEKLKTSEAFAELIALLQNERLQKIVDALYTQEVFLETLRRAKAAGLDLEALDELLSSLFGIHFPKSYARFNKFNRFFRV